MPVKPLFTLVPNPTFDAPGHIPIPGAEPAEITITWRHKTKTELTEWLRDAGGSEDLDLLAAVIAGWGPEVDTPYSRDALASLLDRYPGAAVSLARDYHAALTEGRRKNS